ncbi:MAG TPA: SsrA-binding protein SmpB, partial [Planctomycetota bacterium]|nr:SsrA-binding protein SmpB [Planctomycetota bacterium]
MAQAPKERRSIAQNRRARFEYEILDELDCGIELMGTEVKSLRAGHGSLGEAFAHYRGDELFLLGAHIPVYAHGNIHNHEPTRPRRLLAHRRELDKWSKLVREKGVTIVPLELFFQGSLIKLKLALARGKKLYDKRQAT